MAGQVDLRAAARPGAALTPLGGWQSGYLLQGGLEVVVVSQQVELEPALRRLRTEAEAAATRGRGLGFTYQCLPPRTTTLPLIAIDLEWRPDFRPGSDNPVALVQLAAGRLCLLLRTCQLGFPIALRNFLRDGQLAFVGLNWATADERKMRSSFGWETHHFGSFRDLASLARHGLGARPGLAALADQVLGVAAPKSKQITLSDWAAPRLTADQIRYAALDAALVWHIAVRV